MYIVFIIYHDTLTVQKEYYNGYGPKERDGTRCGRGKENNKRKRKSPLPSTLRILPLSSPTPYSSSSAYCLRGNVAL